MKGKPWFLALLVSLVCPAFAAAQEKPADKFWAACRNGDLATVRAMLDGGISANVDFGAGVTPLGAATARGHAEVVQLLLERGANPNARDDTFQLTPLAIAFFFGQPKLVPILMPKTSEDFDVVLRYSAMMGAVPLVEATVKGKVQPRDVAVAWAVAEATGKKEVIAALEKAGVKAPAKVEATEYPRYTGTYLDKTKMELTLEFRGGKLLATGGSGFSEFFEEEAIPAGPRLLFLKTNPGILFEFSGSGEKFPQAVILIAGKTFPLGRVAGGAK